jgi:mannose-6-phosphate isomerase-like protein (cupin superfamily)
MKLLTILLLYSIAVSGQRMNVDTIGTKSSFEHIYNQKLFSDSLASSFIILIKDEVKDHKHAFHSEHVCILEGRAQMTLGDSTFAISKNDVIFIPKDTWHSVKVLSKEPLKILSVQAPYFDGKDRIMKP